MRIIKTGGVFGFKVKTVIWVLINDPDIYKYFLPPSGKERHAIFDKINVLLLLYIKQVCIHWHIGTCQACKLQLPKKHTHTITSAILG